MLHTLLFVFGFMAIGYIIFAIMYWRDNHCIVKYGFGLLDDRSLLRILAILGFIISLF